MPIPASPSEDARALTCEGYLQMMSSMGVLVGDFYLLLGQKHSTKPWPAHIRRGEMRQCYRNAGELAIERPELAYCEGFAIRAGLIPVHHAWCLDQDGLVLDPTWPDEEGNEYLGVCLDTDFLRTAVQATGYWGLLSECLPQSIVTQHPNHYLHREWRSSEEQIQRFWQKLESVRASS